jgi:hypothetical protein
LSFIQPHYDVLQVIKIQSLADERLLPGTKYGELMNKIKVHPLAFVGIVLIAAGSLFAATPPVDKPASSFSVAEKSEVPGLVLQPGSYSIRVLDHLSDRVIVRVESADGSTHSTFIGLRDPDLKARTTPGQIPWDKAADGKKALRGFTFPGGTTIEFVYPKATAVSIAKVNSSSVPAIDPASEGRIADPSLSKDDMELVTLWMLSSTSVGPNDPAIQAAKFIAAPEPNTVASSSKQMTSSTKSTTPKKPIIAALPHTSSNLPLVELSGAASLFAAVGLFIRRRKLSI